MSNRILSKAWKVSLPPMEKLVLIALADRANDATAQCWPSIETLRQDTGASERTVQRSLAGLRLAGHISRHSDPKRKANVFTVHPRHSDTPDTEAPRHSDTSGVSDSHPMGDTVAPQRCQSDTQTQREPKENQNEPSFRAHECTQEGMTTDLAIQLWNQVAMRCGLAQVTKLRGKPLAHLQSAVREYSVDDWREAMQAIADSDYLLGRKSGFQARLGWLVDPDKGNFDRVRNGEFDNGPDPRADGLTRILRPIPSRTQMRNRRKAMRSDFTPDQLVPEVDVQPAFADEQIPF